MKRTFPITVRAVMIDLDGTMLDTVPDLAAATNLMLQSLGRATLALDTVSTYVGKGIPRLVERALAGSIDGHVGEAEMAQALPVFERCYAQVNGRHTKIYPGVREGLDALHVAGFPLACVTNKSGVFVQPLLEHMKLDRYFSQIIAGDTLQRKKPDPLPLLHACRQFGVAPEHMLMIGDSLNDVAAARAAGCPVFCVPYGYNEGQAVQSLDVDAIVAALTDCISLIKKG